METSSTILGSLAPKSLTTRDLKLLKLLFDFGVVSSVQMSKWIFPGVARATVLRRLRVLEERGLIRKRGTLPNATSVWMIDAKGQKVIAGMTESLYFPAHQLEHEIALNEIRWRLHGLGVVQSWMNERELRRRASGSRYTDKAILIIPDAVILIKRFVSDNPFVQLEVELHLKSNERYKKLFSRFDPHEGKARKWLWYMVPSHPMGRRILKYAKKYAQTYARHYVGYTVIDEFLARPWSATFHQTDQVTPLSSVMNIEKPKGDKTNTPAQEGAQGLSTLESRGNNVFAA